MTPEDQETLSIDTTEIIRELAKKEGMSEDEADAALQYWLDHHVDSGEIARQYKMIKEAEAIVSGPRADDQDA